VRAGCEIATALGCATQTVRTMLHAPERRGLEVLTEKPRRRKSATKLFDAARRERLHALLHRNPRAFA
jgi:transposase